MFLKKVNKLLANHNKKELSPSSLVTLWDEFVSECEDIYGWTIYEFDNEIGIRDCIDIILNEKEMYIFPEFKEFKSLIDSIDRRFNDLLQKNNYRTEVGNKWWRKGILKFAGEEYCSDIFNLYGIIVESDVE